MSVEIKHISNHGKSSNGTSRTVNTKFAQYSIVHGKGSKRKAFAFHGTKEQAEKLVEQYK